MATEPNQSQRAPSGHGKHHPFGSSYVLKEDVNKIIKECKEESFWYRALPLSITSMAVTQGLVYQGVLSRSQRFGSLPKVVVAGILGFVIGKISYFGVCRKKFHDMGIQPFGPGIGQGFQRGCPHVCAECRSKEGSTEDPTGCKQSDPSGNK
ncbi:OCIA domain-containing protein 2 [Latimeria chalumnae]|uniref:OCIA domain containing 2 n=1 Tax=Latimeria chalumnae TaxID=7897 RepID=H3B2N5_LATCH|nr:PREDICTED: OCIA domain-containing protein 2 [Latimeria chalumnae]|eukprot:XP_005998626.1 PREDICTED: OCIA domain-containing protein 2 [Latimeria chalumnae]